MEKERVPQREPVAWLTCEGGAADGWSRRFRPRRDARQSCVQLPRDPHRGRDRCDTPAGPGRMKHEYEHGYEAMLGPETHAGSSSGSLSRLTSCRVSGWYWRSERRKNAAARREDGEEPLQRRLECPALAGARTGPADARSKRLDYVDLGRGPRRQLAPGNHPLRWVLFRRRTVAAAECRMCPGPPG